MQWLSRPTGLRLVRRSATHSVGVPRYAFVPLADVQPCLEPMNPPPRVRRPDVVLNIVYAVGQGLCCVGNGAQENFIAIRTLASSEENLNNIGKSRSEKNRQSRASQ